MPVICEALGSLLLVRMLWFSCTDKEDRSVLIVGPEVSSPKVPDRVHAVLSAVIDGVIRRLPARLGIRVYQLAVLPEPEPETKVGNDSFLKFRPIHFPYFKCLNPVLPLPLRSPEEKEEEELL